jgi:hypothetical protein
VINLHTVEEKRLKREQALGDSILAPQELGAPDGHLEDEVLGWDSRIRTRELDALELDSVIKHGIARHLDEPIRIRLFYFTPPEQIIDNLDIAATRPKY